MSRFYLATLALAACLATSARSATLEYFWDTDPGLGKATQIEIGTPVDGHIEADLQIQNPNTPGTHRLFLRVAYDNDNWGPTYSPIQYFNEATYDPAQLESVHYQIINAAGSVVYTSPNHTGTPTGNALSISTEVDTTSLGLTPGVYQLEAVATNKLGLNTLHKRYITITGPPNTRPILKFLSPPELDSTTQNDPDPTGTLVSDLVAQLLPKQAYDAEANTLSLALASLDFSNGDWQYRPATSSKWLDLDIPPKTTAFTLLPNDRIRFLPDTDFAGPSGKAFTFHLWDQQAGPAREFIPLSSSEALNSFSQYSGYASILVKKADPPPVYTGKIDFELPNTGGALRLDLNALFETSQKSSLSYALESIAKPELFSKYGIDQKTGVLVLYPKTGESGTSTFAVSATDDQKRKTTAELSINVVSKNLAPTFSKIPAIKLTTSQASSAVDISKFVSNPESPTESLSYTLQLPSNPYLAKATIDPSSGKLSLTAALKQQGTVTLTLLATDEAGNRATQTMLVFVATSPPVKVNSSAFLESLDLVLTQTAPRPEKDSPIGFSFKGDMGATYELQKSSNLRNWFTESSITISGTTRAELAGQFLSGDIAAFWRIIKSADGVPLAVSEVIATYNTGNALGGILLEIESSSRELIENIVFYDGDIALGNATKLSENHWAFTVQYDPNDPKAAEIYAIADGAEGHQTISSTTRMLLADPALFIALDETGEPTYGQLIAVNEDGSLPAFRYFPKGSNPTQNLLWIDFPSGTRLEQVDGRKRLLFESAALFLGSTPDEPFSLPAGSLPAGTLRFSELEALLGETIADGIPLLLWGSQAILWTGGPLPSTVLTVVDPPQFEILTIAPTPRLSQSETTTFIPPSGVNDTAYQQTWYGEFLLPGANVRLFASRKNPLWLTLYPNGSFLLKGAVEVHLPNGGKFKGSLHFAHPTYTIQIGAESIEIPLLGNLVEILPDNPESCIPNTDTPNDQELTKLQACLNSYLKAYQNFATAAGKNAFADADATDETIDGFFPTQANLATSALEAWGHSLAASIENQANLTLEAATGQRLSELFGHQAKAAIAAEFPADLAEHLAALSRIRATLADEALSSLSSVDKAALNTEFDRVLDAMIDRIQNSEKEITLDQVKRLGRAALDTVATSQQSGLAISVGNITVIADYIAAFRDRYKAEVGLLVAAEDPQDSTKTIFRARQEGDPTPAYKDKNRFELLFVIKQLIELETDLTLLGHAEDSDLDEMGEFLTDVYALVESDYQVAHQTGDARTALYAIRDLVEIEASRESFGVEGSNLSEIESKLLEIGLTLNSNAYIPKPRDFLTEGRYLASILAQIPDSKIAKTFGGKHYNRLALLLDNLFDIFPINPLDSSDFDTTQLLAILELGLLRDRLSRSGDYSEMPNVNWLDPQSYGDARLGRFVQALSRAAGATPGNTSARNWTAIHKAAELILTEVDLLESEYINLTDETARADRLQRRFKYLSYLSSLLTHYRTVVVADWIEGAATLGTHSSLSDLFLPGDIRFEKLAGSASFNVETHFFSGSFSGKVRLPKFNTSLTVPNGSFDTNGNLAFSAFGTTTFPAQGQSVTLTVPERRPLSLELGSTGKLAIGGGARLDLPNGMHFEGYFDIDDPEYLFGAEAGGLRFELAKSLTLTLPHVSTTKFAAASNETRAALNAYFSSIGRAIIPLIDQATDLPPPNFNDIGTPPEFNAPTVTFELSDLAAWGNAASADLAAATEEAFKTAAEGMKSNLKESITATIADLKSARSAFANVSRELAYIQNANTRLAIIAKGLKKEAARQLSGINDETGTLNLLREEAKAVSDLALANLRATSVDSFSISAINTAMRTAVDAETNYTLLGGVEGTNLGELSTELDLKYQELRNKLLQQYGISTVDTSVVDPEKYKTLGQGELLYVVRTLINMQAALDYLGSGENFDGLSISTALVGLRYQELTREDGPATPPEQRRVETPEQRLKRFMDAMKIAAEFESIGQISSIDTSTIIADLQSEVTVYQQYLANSRPDLSQADVLTETAKTLARLQNQQDREAAAREREFSALSEAQEIHNQTITAAQKGKPASNPFSKLVSVINTLAERSGESTADNAALSSIDAYVNRQLLSLAESDLSSQDLSSISNFAAENLEFLIFALEFAGNTADDFESSIDIAVPTLLLQNLTITFNEVAEAKKAWWLTEQYLLAIEASLEKYGDGLVSGAQTALKTAQADTLKSSHAILTSLSATLDAFDLKDYLFPLPGDIQIDRIFGQLAFNRITGEWELKLGGRVSFPDIDGYFEIVDSTFDRDNGFSLHLRASTPIPIQWAGETVELTVDGGFILAGGWDGHIRDTEFAARISHEENGSPVSYAANISYHFNADEASHTFGVFVAINDDITIFGNDLVVFHGGVGSDVTATEAGFTSAVLYTDAIVGILNKNTTFPAEYNPTQNDFKLLYQGKVILDTKANGDVAIALRQGLLKLPEGFESRACSDPTKFTPSPTSRATVSIEELSFAWHNSDQALELAGNLGLSNIRFAIKDYEQLWLDVCDMSLEFTYDTSTKISTAGFRDVNAVINVPLPEGKFARAELDQGDWSLGGFPTFELSLVKDLALIDSAPLTVSLLGQNTLGHARSSIQFAESSGGRSIIVTGFAQAKIVSLFHNAANDPVDLKGGVSSVLTISLPEDNSAPSFEDIDWAVGAIEVGATGELYLGSAGEGLFILDPSIRLENPLGIFASQFELAFDFGMGIALSDEEGATGETIALSTKGSRIVFNQSAGSPFFLPGQTCYTYGEAPGDEAASQNLLGEGAPPFMVRKLCIDFRSPTSDSGYISLFPQEGTPLAVFDTSNIAVTLSADLNIADIVTGSVDDLVMRFIDGKPTASVNGLGFGVDLSEFIGFPTAGTVYIGGLQHFPQIFLSGKFTVNVKGNAIDALGVLDSKGLRGICFGLAGSDVSIPLPYGFTLNGAQGGLALGAYVKDPCAFKAFYPIDPVTGKPRANSIAPYFPLPDFAVCDLLTWDELTALRDANVNTGAVQAEAELAIKRYRLERRLVLDFNMTSTDAAELLAGLDAAEMEALVADLNEDIIANEDPVAEFSICPDPSNCPPAALGIAGQPHPEAFVTGSEYEGRTIFKFTSIDEPTLNAFGVTFEKVSSIVGSSNAQQIAARFANEIVAGVGGFIPRLPEDFPDQQIADDINAGIEDTLQTIELGFANSLICAIEASGAPTDATEVYLAILEAAYAGIPYEDVTIKVTGEFSYTGVGSFASVTGGMIQSSNGSRGLVGQVKFLGVPVGGAELYLNQFDAYGNLDAPNLCGKIDARIGPLELGSGALLFDCPGCVAKSFQAVENAVNSLSSQYVYDVMVRIKRDYPNDPNFVPNPNYSPLDHFAMLDSDDKRQAFLGWMISLPPVDSFGNYAEAYLAFLTDVANAIIPRLSTCGAIQPKLFGFPLTGGNDAYSYKAYIGPANPDPEKTEDGILLIESFSFSPSRILGQTLLAGMGIPPNSITELIFPAFDSATANMRVAAPAPGNLLRDSLTKDPVTFAEERLRDLLSNSVFTFEYDLAPWGLQLGRSGGRILMPSFDHHPNSSSSLFSLSNQRFTAPSFDEQLANRGLPSRLEVLLASLGGDAGSDAPNYLADPAWSGKGSEAFDQIFANTEFEGQFSGDINLTDNFFPHGGFLGASSLSLPKLITSGLPPSAAELLIPNRTLPEYTQSAEELFSYLFSMDEVGELAFYIPAPNPPVSEFPGSTTELIEGLTSFDPSLDFGTFYPAKQAFMRGWTDTPILGIPTTRSEITLDGDAGTLNIEASIPADSWLELFIGQANLRFTVAPGDTRNNPFSDAFWETYAKLLTATDQTAADQILADFLTTAWDGTKDGLSALANFYQVLPKVSATLTGQDINLPNPLNLAGDPLASISEASFEVYSPYFGLAGADSDSPLDLVRREGGIGFAGRMELRSGDLIDIPRVEFSISTDPDKPLQFPTLKGYFELETFTLWSVFESDAENETFSGAIDISDTGSSLTLNAQTEKLFLYPFGNYIPRPDDASGQVESSLALVSDENGWQDFTLSIEPGELQNPFFSKTLHLYLHGEKPTDNFSFSASDPWSASGHFEGTGGMDLRVNSSIWIRIEPQDTNWTETASVTTSDQGIAITNLPIGTLISFPQAPIVELRDKQLSIGPSGTLSLNLTEDDFQLSATVDQAFPFSDKLEFRNGFSLQASSDGIVFEGSMDPIELQLIDLTLASITPLASDSLNVRLESTASSGFALSVSPAKLDLNVLGLQQELSIHGTESTASPFTINSAGAWSAAIELNEFALGKIGDQADEAFVRISPSNSSAPLLSAALAGNGFSSLSFDATRSGNVDIDWFSFSSIGKSLENINPGTLRFRLNNSGFSLTASSPTAMLAFDGLPPLTAKGSLTIDSTGFLVTGLSTGAAKFPITSSVPLLELSGDANSALILRDDILTLTVSPPDAKILGFDLSINDLDTVEFALDFRNAAMDVAVMTDRSRDLLEGGILALKPGTHRLSGSLSNGVPQLALDIDAVLNLKYPNPNNLSQTLTRSIDIPLHFNSSGALTPKTISSNLPEFDLGWLALQKGTVSFDYDTIAASRTSPAFGFFSLAFAGWDLEVFGEQFNNLGMSVSSLGIITATAGNASNQFSLGAILLDIREALPFAWNLETGAIELRLPTSTLLKLPDLLTMGGSFATGLDLPPIILSANGTFDETFTRNLVIGEGSNAFTLATASVNLRRASSGIMTLEIDHTLGYELGPNMKYYLLARSNNTFTNRISGQLALPTGPGEAFEALDLLFDGLDGSNDNQITFAAAELDLQASSTPTFAGTVQLGAFEFELSLSTQQSKSFVKVGAFNLPLPTL